MHKNARNIHTESASAWHLAAVFARKVPSDFSRIKKFTHCSGMAPFVSNAGQQGSRSSSEPMQLSHIRGTCLPFMTDKSDTLKHDHLHMYAHACVLSRAHAHTHTHTEKKKKKSSMTMKCTFSHQQSFTRLHFYVQWETAKMENSSASVSKVYATFFLSSSSHTCTHAKNIFFLMTYLTTKSWVYPRRQLQGNANRMQGLGNRAPCFSVPPS